MNTNSHVYDVVIIGGGVAGCATALSLHRSSPGASFLVVDDSEPSSFKIGESLPAEARRWLAYLASSTPTTESIVERLSKDTAHGVHTTCSGNASAWQSPDVQETFAMMNPFGQGWHLDRAAFDESLRERLRLVTAESDEPAGILRGKFVTLRKDGGLWVVTTVENRVNQEYRSRWLVDASGRKASVAQRLGAKTVRTDGLLAFYGLFTSPNADDDPEYDPDRRTFIEAAESGWWYTSQLSHGKRIVVFHTDDCDHAVTKRARKRDGFLDLLRETSTHISGIIEGRDYCLVEDGNYPRCTAASSSYLEPCGDDTERWCAVGDAAIAFDPLSSQGMITALKTGGSVGIMLSRQLGRMGGGTETETEKASVVGVASMRALYDATRKDYEKKKDYFYTQSMFDGEFWQRRRGSPSV